MQHIAVLLGGISPERDVSLVTGSEVAKELRTMGYAVSEFDPADFQHGFQLMQALHNAHPDVVFIGLHGGDGENGSLQAMLSQSGFRYTGSGFRASAIAMDKLISKLLAMKAGAPVPRYWICDKSDFEKATPDFQHVLHEIYHHDPSTKLIVKPVDAGSSVGISIVKDVSDWLHALETAFKYADRVLVEAFIEGRELTVTILDDTPLPLVEIIPHEGWYDYQSKYTKGKTTYVAPAEIDTAVSEKMQQRAMRIWKMTGCHGYGRIDFRYDGKESYFLEINTLPGMTPLSLTPKAAQSIGLSFGDLLNKIIATAGM
jgi:D-alanine-D-alanine ligase